VIAILACFHKGLVEATDRTVNVIEETMDVAGQVAKTLVGTVMKVGPQ
jgi:hypothetical protein